jgi:hypothetical protein
VREESEIREVGEVSPLRRVSCASSVLAKVECTRHSFGSRRGEFDSVSKNQHSKKAIDSIKAGVDTQEHSNSPKFEITISPGDSMHDRKVPLFKHLTCALTALTLGLGVQQVVAQPGAGAKFGARDPRTCSSRNQPAKGAPTAAQLRQYFICQEEGVTKSYSGSVTLNLLTDVVVQVGNGRPFNIATDSWPDVDPSKTVYPIRGGYTQWSCGVLGEDGYVAGHSCNRVLQPHASGICYMDSFGDWQCKFMDGNAAISNACPGGGGATECLLPAPTGN